ncbi:MAG: cytochrome oxidase putative small subunit CydP [Aliidongia sp.]
MNRLRAFLDRSYRREIVLVVCLKVVGLALLYFLFFAPNDRTDLPQHLVARHLLDMPQTR